MTKLHKYKFLDYSQNALKTRDFFGKVVKRIVSLKQKI